MNKQKIFTGLIIFSVGYWAGRGISFISENRKMSIPLSSRVQQGFVNPAHIQVENWDVLYGRNHSDKGYSETVIRIGEDREPYFLKTEGTNRWGNYVNPRLERVDLRTEMELF